MKTVIIGAGASGIIAALKASYKSKVIILEKNDKPLKKLLLTGNSHCNYWNENISLDKYETDSKENLLKILERREDTYHFLEDLGIYPRIKDGYYYPYSNQAYSFKEVLMQNTTKKNIEIIYNADVKDFYKENNEFIIKYNNEVIKADKLIVACGGCACPKTGSDGKLLAILTKLGHSVNPLLPALTSLKCEGSYTKIWSGIRAEGLVRLIVNGTLIEEEIGEVQLTDYGLSGVCVFNLSSMAAKSLNKNNLVDVQINFFPHHKDFATFLEERCRKMPTCNIFEVLESLFNYKLIDIFLHQAHINTKAYYKSLTKKEKEDLVKIITRFTIRITGTSSFDKAQVSSGGVSLKEINPLTMESSIISNLFIIGEALDVNAKCGGYNLAHAFITGFIAGEN